MTISKRNFLYYCIYCALLLASADISNLPPECKLHNEKILDCSNMNHFPNGSFGDVEVVNFSDNQFRELPRDVFYNNGFRVPTTIILRYSRINHIQFKAFSFMSNTMQLDLYGNELTKLHRSAYIGLTSLRHLFLGNNRIKVLENLGSLKFLDKLDLSNNTIEELPKDFLKHDYLTYLDLSWNPVVFAGPGPILESASLNQLFLRSCNLEELPSEAFVGLEKLQILDLSRNKLRKIQNSLFEPLSELKYLDISYNLITRLEPEMFVSAKLKELNCVGNPTQVYRGCEDFFVTTAKTLDKTTNLSHITEDDQSGIILSQIKLVSPTKPKNTSNGEETSTIESLLKTIVAVGGICALLLVVLGCQMCYFKYMPKSTATHIYEEVDYSKQLRDIS